MFYLKFDFRLCKLLSCCFISLIMLVMTLLLITRYRPNALSAKDLGQKVAFIRFDREIVAVSIAKSIIVSRLSLNFLNRLYIATREKLLFGLRCLLISRCIGWFWICLGCNLVDAGNGDGELWRLPEVAQRKIAIAIHHILFEGVSEDLLTDPIVKVKACCKGWWCCLERQVRIAHYQVHWVSLNTIKHW